MSGAALTTLTYVPVVLPELEVLELHHSQIALSQTTALATAVASFSQSLQELVLDCWPCAAVDAKASADEFGHEYTNRVLLTAVCSLPHLKVLEVPDWGVVVGADGGGHVRLTSLERISVASYPCGACTAGKCVHFPDDLPFHPLHHDA